MIFLSFIWTSLKLYGNVDVEILYVLRVFRDLEINRLKIRGLFVRRHVRLI
jgi:hypothetical protein